MTWRSNYVPVVQNFGGCSALTETLHEKILTCPCLKVIWGHRLGSWWHWPTSSRCQSCDWWRTPLMSSSSTLLISRCRRHGEVTSWQPSLWNIATKVATFRSFTSKYNASSFWATPYNMQMNSANAQLLYTHARQPGTISQQTTAN